MASIPHRELSETPRIAIYARVSTEDQAERQTVQAQVEFLRRFCGLYDWPVVGEYVDDGWSGTIPLADREYGRQMLDELPTTQPTKILVYRLDRLGRSVRVLLDAHTTLEDKGIAIQSATEPFDTSTPIGRFVFQLLGSIAELERSTSTERMALGRDRVARQGKWTGGPIPYGYDLDADSCLVPSVRLVEPTDQTEAQVAREVFERIAAGSSAVREAKRLQALGVPCFRRWAGGKELVTSGVWHADRIAHMIRNSSYKGT